MSPTETATTTNSEKEVGQYTEREKAQALTYALALMRDRLRLEAPLNAAIVQRHIYALLELIAVGR